MEIVHRIYQLSRAYVITSILMNGPPDSIQIKQFSHFTDVGPDVGLDNLFSPVEPIVVCENSYAI